MEARVLIDRSTSRLPGDALDRLSGSKSSSAVAVMTGTGVASPDGKGTGAVPPRRLFIEAARPIGKEVGNIVYPHQWGP